MKSIKNQGGWLWVPAAIAGAASLLGGRAANKASSAQALRQMDFQERMSNTAHQRQVKDLRSAGLNPILSAGGSGASSPSGAQALQKDVITPAVSSAMQAYGQQAQVGLVKAQTGNTQASTAQTIAQTKIIEANIPKQSAQAIVWKRIESLITDLDNITSLAGRKKTLAQLQEIMRNAPGAWKAYFNRRNTDKKLPINVNPPYQEKNYP